MKKNDYFSDGNVPIIHDKILSLNEIATLKIFIYFSPLEATHWTPVSKSWCIALNKAIYWSVVLNQLYECTPALTKVQGDEKCNPKAIYKTQVKILQEYRGFLGQSFGLIGFQDLKKILGFEPVIKAIAMDQITFEQAIKLTTAHIKLIQTMDFKITQVVQLEDYQAQSFLNRKLKKPHYKATRWGRLSSRQLASLNLKDKTETVRYQTHTK